MTQHKSADESASGGAASQAIRLVGFRRFTTIDWQVVVSRLAIVFILAMIFAPIIQVMYEPMTRFWEQLRVVAALPGIGRTIFNTFVLAGGTLVLALTFGTFFGWSSGQLSPGYARVASILTTSSLFVPPIAGVIGWIFLFSPRIGYANVLLRATPFFDGRSGPVDIRSLSGIIVIDTIYLIPFVFLYVSTALRAVDPALESAAMVSGSSWIGAQFRIVLRIIRPAIIYGAVIVMLLGLGQFTVPLVLGSNQGINVITTEIFNQLEVRAIPQEVTAAFLALPLILAGFALVFLQRLGVGDVNRFSVASKGVGGHRRARNYLILPIIVYAFIAVVPGGCGAAYRRALTVLVGHNPSRPVQPGVDGGDLAELHATDLNNQFHPTKCFWRRAGARRFVHLVPVHAFRAAGTVQRVRGLHGQPAADHSARRPRARHIPHLCGGAVRALWNRMALRNCLCHPVPAAWRQDDSERPCPDGHVTRGGGAGLWCGTHPDAHMDNPADASTQRRVGSLAHVRPSCRENSRLRHFCARRAIR